MANKQNATPQESVVKTMVVPVIVLVVICVVCSAILAVLNDMTAPIIEENTRLEIFVMIHKFLIQSKISGEFGL